LAADYRPTAPDKAHKSQVRKPAQRSGLREGTLMIAPETTIVRA
jgi:hypothetical protein